jgi:hypothetical protein
VEGRLAELHKTLELYSDRRSTRRLIRRDRDHFMAWLFALMPMLVFLRSGGPLIAHAAFSLHFYSFCCCCCAWPPWSRPWTDGLEVRLTTYRLDQLLSISLLMASAVISIFHRTVYARAASPVSRRRWCSWCRGRDRAGLPVCAAARHALQHVLSFQ